MNTKKGFIHKIAELLSNQRGITTITSSTSGDSFITTHNGVAYKVTLEEIGTVEKEDTSISSELTKELLRLSDDFLN